MTLEETRSVLKVLRINYPHSFKDLSQQDTKDYLSLWAEMFKHDDYRLVKLAVLSIINGDKREFAPNVGQVKDMMYRLSSKKEIDADEAWEMVYKATCRGIYHADEEFAKLPAEVQAGVGSPSQLREWAQMDSAVFQSVIASNFKRSYCGRVEAMKEYNKLPNEAKKMIGELTGKMKTIE